MTNSDINATVLLKSHRYLCITCESIVRSFDPSIKWSFVRNSCPGIQENEERKNNTKQKNGLQFHWFHKSNGWRIEKSSKKNYKSSIHFIGLILTNESWSLTRCVHCFFISSPIAFLLYFLFVRSFVSFVCKLFDLCACV